MQDHPDALVREKDGISVVWLVPAIALVFGVWLMVKTVLEQGFYITVQFENASGMVVGKTEVRYKGLPVGKVAAIKVTDDLQHVDVEIEMVSATKEFLTDKTKFWYVTADISLQGISGLETLLSGGYINLQPELNGQGESIRQFVALNEPPILDEATPGLHISLTTDTLGSLGRNSPVSFKQIVVGHVSGYQFDQQTNQVRVSVFIEPDYAHLVKTNSKFWNVSGFDISGSLTTGVKINTESLTSIVSGGIAFDDPKFETILPPARNGKSYPLYDDYQSAEMGHEITLELNWDAGVDRGARIQYQGLTLGVIDSFSKIDPETRKMTAVAKVNPRIVPYLTSDSQFFVVAPEVDFGGVTNLHNVLKGPHISLRPSLNGEPKARFSVYNRKPAYRYDEPGLHLMLQATHVESIKPGTRIFYRKQEVGSVQAVENKISDEVLVHIHILPQYKQYVSANTRFWNLSGLRISGNLQSFELQAHSIQSVLAGGIELDTDKSDAGETAINGDTFKLYQNKDTAKQSETLLLTALSSKNVNTRTRIIYRGDVVGSIQQIKQTDINTQIIAGLLPEYRFLLKAESKFWLVKPNVSIAGLGDTDALFGGAYIAVNAGQGDEHRQFALTHDAPAKAPHSEGLQLQISSLRSTSVNPGSPVSYRGIDIGQIDNVTLDQTSDQITINITIDEQYRNLIQKNSRFYNASGVSLTGSLGNFSVETASAESILGGGLSLYNPTKNNRSNVEELASYILFDSKKHAELAGEEIEIFFNDIDGLTPNLKISYQGQQIGTITRVVLNENFGATAHALISDVSFTAKGTKFWLARPEIGLVGNKNVMSLINGDFVEVLPGSGVSVNEFIAEDTPPAITSLPYGLNITIQSEKLNSIRVGNPILFRQVKVGEVIGIDLADNADRVNIYINIIQRYASLVTSKSKFWNASGFTFNGGVFSGVNIESESIETLLSGGISFATPESAETGAGEAQGLISIFKLHDEAKDEWLEWAPQIKVSR